MIDFRKHVAWYLKGFSVGSELRGALAQASSLAELDDLLARLDLDQPFPDAVLGQPRGRTTGARGRAAGGLARLARQSRPCRSGPSSPTAAAEAVIRDLLDRHIADGTIPGAVAIVGADDAEVVAAGVMSVGGSPMRPDAIMRIQSMTKVVTATAALRLVEAGRIDLDSAVDEWLPELADRSVLRTPTSALDDTEPARGPITLRHLLTNTSGYGMQLHESPLQTAMLDNGTEAGPLPPAVGADEWLRLLADLPLAYQPGEGWRYHHSFAVLGILLSRLTGRPLGEHLADDLFGPLGMTDTGFWVPNDRLDRLPAAYRHGENGLVETEPAGGGFYAGPPPFDVSHAELVSTAQDFHRFVRALVNGSLVSPEHLELLRTDQVPSSCKTPESFFPGFWSAHGLGLRRRRTGSRPAPRPLRLVGWPGHRLLRRP